MSWWDDGYSHRIIEVRPSATVNYINMRFLRDTKGAIRYLPLALVVHNELEDTMTVRGAEGDGVLARGILHWRKTGADMRIEHGEFKLQVGQSRVRLPGRAFRLPLRNGGGIDLESKSKYGEIQ